jgi:hypothetical protein
VLTVCWSVTSIASARSVGPRKPLLSELSERPPGYGDNLQNRQARLGYMPSVHQMISGHSSLAASGQLRGATSVKGHHHLVACQRLELTVEARMLRNPFPQACSRTLTIKARKHLAFHA